MSWAFGETASGRKVVTSITAFFVVTAIMLANVSCFSERDAMQPVLEGEDCRIPSAAIGVNRTIVAVRNFTFFPDTVRVRAGSEVVWVNCETTVPDYHTSTSSTGAWNSGALNRGEFYVRRFDAQGQFGYFCEPHPFMQGAVIVQ
jgi:plastocyanin